MIVMYAAVLSFKVKSKISPTKTNEVRSKTEIKCEKRCLLTGFFLTANFILCYLPLFTLQLIKVNLGHKFVLLWKQVSKLFCNIELNSVKHRSLRLILIKYSKKPSYKLYNNQ